VPAVSPSEHFSSYTDNNRIKHEILSRYLKQYTTALSRTVGGFHYIDGFAGRGRYGEVDGSPLRALAVLSAQKLPFSMSLIEADPDLAAELRKALAPIPRPSHMIDEPWVEEGHFSEHLKSVLTRPVYTRHRNVATFAFLDPCRASGYVIEEIDAILGKSYGECLVFWNYDGVIRWLGAIASEHARRTGMIRMLGSADALERALAIHDSARIPAEKERDLLTLFLESLQAHARAKFLIPFRFTSDTSRRTSHFLIHCSRDPLPFRLMKQVMGSLSDSPEPGEFSYLGTATVGAQFSMFEPDAKVQAREAILQELGGGPRPVSRFTRDWVERPQDLLRERDYKTLLIELEREGRVAILRQDGKTLYPAAKRPSRKGAPSLADDLVAALAREEGTDLFSRARK
jgi:three-Cys-motif partner protein